MLLFCCSSLCCFFRRRERLILIFNLRIRTSREGEGVIPRGLYLFIFGKGTKKWCGILPQPLISHHPKIIDGCNFSGKGYQQAEKRQNKSIEDRKQLIFYFMSILRKYLRLWLSQSNIFFPYPGFCLFISSSQTEISLG